MFTLNGLVCFHGVELLFGHPKIQTNRMADFSAHQVVIKTAHLEFIDHSTNQSTNEDESSGQITIIPKPELVGGFNPFEKY